jgi:hypothetical protein
MKNMLTNGVHVILQLLGNKVVFLKQKENIETGTKNTGPLVSCLSRQCKLILSDLKLTTGIFYTLLGI